MGMYTELMLRCQMDNVPEEVSTVLRCMADSYSFDLERLPNHDFFKCDRWMSIGSSSSYYFTPISCINFRQSTLESTSWFLIVACDLKNYGDEIDKFLDWIKPYLKEPHGDTRTPIGWKRYEEDDEPTIIYSF